jgi:hypothetical protein
LEEGLSEYRYLFPLAFETDVSEVADAEAQLDGGAVFRALLRPVGKNIGKNAT